MFSVPLAGMESAQYLLGVSASRIANASGIKASSTGGQAGDSLQLSDQMTSILEALQTFEANSKVLETEVSLAESSLSITA